MVMLLLWLVLLPVKGELRKRQRGTNIEHFLLNQMCLVDGMVKKMSTQSFATWTGENGCMQGAYMALRSCSGSLATIRLFWVRVWCPHRSRKNYISNLQSFASFLLFLQPFFSFVLVFSLFCFPALFQTIVLAVYPTVNILGPNIWRACNAVTVNIWFFLTLNKKSPRLTTKDLRV